MTASGIQVRPIRFGDFLRLRGMRADALPPHQIHGRMGQSFADPWSMAPFCRRERKAFVGFLEGRAVGLLDMLADATNHRWVMSRLLTWRQIPDSAGDLRDTIWRELTLQAIRAAGAARAKRIHATLPEHSAVMTSLLAIGFAAYAQDTVLKARSLPSTSAAGIVRRQDASDVWAIHQLYHSVTPRPVQYAEALTSNYWGKPAAGQSASRCYVVEDGFEVVAHCKVAFGADTPVFHLMVHPDALHLLVPVIRDVADDLGNVKRGLSIVVPDYLQEYINQLESLGFVPERRQSRLVKYTVVARRMQFRGVEELAREAPERAVTGAPSIYYSPREYESKPSTNGIHGVQ